MTLLFDGESAFFAEREGTLSHTLSIFLPDESALFCRGLCFYPKDGSVRLPRTILKQGKNTLSLRVGEKIFPCEGLLFDGDRVAPCGMPVEALLLRQHKRLLSANEALATLTARVEALEQAAKSRMLFS
jgi:hypothetical protein